MICILVGVVPYKKEYWDEIKNIASVSDHSEDHSIDWRSCSKVVDDDIPTFVVSATSEIADANCVIQAVQEKLRSKYGQEAGITCEMWATAPSPLWLRPDGGYQLSFHESNNSTSHHKDQCEWDAWAGTTMREMGIMVQPQILDSNRVCQLRSLVDQAIHNVEESLALHRPDIQVGKDAFCFQEIASRNLERFDLCLTDPEILEFVKKNIMDHPKVKATLNSCVGSSSDADFDVSVVYSKPGACSQGWHADGDHQKGGQDAGWTKYGWNTQLANAYAICLFIPLIELNDETGFTQFWPRSHYSRDFAGFGKVAELIETTFDGKCNAGDAVFYDYRLFHRGMPNNSDIIRPVLQVIFKKKWYVEKANYGEETIAQSSVNIVVPPCIIME